MKLNLKIKLIRESKNFSQIYLAHELGLNQSQYSRREKGEIQFNSDEIIKLSHLLETPISNLFSEQQNIISEQSHNHDIVSISAKLIEQYEWRLKEKDEMIKFLFKNK